MALPASARKCYDFLVFQRWRCWFTGKRTFFPDEQAISKISPNFIRHWATPVKTANYAPGEIKTGRQVPPAEMASGILRRAKACFGRSQPEKREFVYKCKSSNHIFGFQNHLIRGGLRRPKSNKHVTKYLVLRLPLFREYCVNLVPVWLGVAVSTAQLQRRIVISLGICDYCPPVVPVSYTHLTLPTIYSV